MVFMLTLILSLQANENLNRKVESITGSTAVCVGSTIQLTDGVSGGSWSSSSKSYATVNSSGVVTGVAATSLVTITHTATGYSSSINITVNALPTITAISEGNSAAKSKKQFVKTITKTSPIVKVFPNPTNGVINVQLPNNGNWQITATDITGKIVWEQECNGCTGVLKHSFNNAKGLYFIKIINTITGQQFVKKINLQ